MTPWTVACQAPLSIAFPKQEYWSGLPFPSPGHLLNPGIETMSPALQAFFTTEPPGKPTAVINHHKSGDTKEHKFILLKSWRSEIQKGVSLDWRVSRASSSGLGARPFFVFSRTLSCISRFCSLMIPRLSSMLATNLFEFLCLCPSAPNHHISFFCNAISCLLGHLWCFKYLFLN